MEAPAFNILCIPHLLKCFYYFGSYLYVQFEAFNKTSAWVTCMPIQSTSYLSAAFFSVQTLFSGRAPDPSSSC
jgi:hypothetical protein